MKKIRHLQAKLLVAGAVIALVGVAWYQLTAFSVAEPTPAELLIAQNRWPETDADSLYDGYKTFTTRCTKCHGLKNVGRFTETEWASTLNKMAKKAKLNEEEKENVKRYILTEREYLLAPRPAKARI